MLNATESPSAQVLAVNVAEPTLQPFLKRRTAIVKLPVAGPVEGGRLGLAGDRAGNPKHHGGPDKAVYAFAREDLDLWADRLGLPIVDGGFGENLTTRGIDVNAAELGERWRIGTVELEIASVRTPCRVFTAWLGHQGFDTAQWVKRFAAEGRPGPYLRVLTPGRLQAGDRIDVTHRPGHGVDVSTMFRAITTDRELLPELLRVEGLAAQARETAERYVAAATRK